MTKQVNAIKPGVFFVCVYNKTQLIAHASCLSAVTNRV